MRNDSGMFIEFSVRGLWGLPGQAANQTSGTLRFSNERIELQLDHTFFIPELVGAWTPGCFKASVIVGQSNDGDRWTILGAFFHRWSGNEAILVARGILRGECIQEISKFPLRKAVLEFTHLEEWTGKQIYVDKEISGMIAVSAPDQPEVVMSVQGIPGIKNLVLDWGVAQSFHRTRITLTNQCRFHVEFEPDGTLSSVEHVMRQLSGLLTILVGRAVYPRSARLLGRSANETNDSPIEYLVALRAGPITERSGFQMVLPYKMLKECGEEKVFARWFSSEETLRPVTDLLLTTFYYASPYTQGTFLSLAQAMESFHRRTREGLYVSTDDYEKIKENMLPSIPGDTETKLKRKLQGMMEWGNEFSLKDRLRELFEAHDAKMLLDLTGQNELKEFVKLLCDTRNYLTHYKGLKPKVIDSVHEMYNLNQRIRAILVLMILKYLGIREVAVFTSLKSDLGLVV